MLTRMKPSVLKAILKQAVSKPEAVARIQKARKAVNTKPSPAQADAGRHYNPCWCRCAAVCFTIS